MKLFSTKRRKVAVVGVSVALIAGLSGLAAAFFTSSGGGAGNAPIGTSSNVVIHQIGNTIYDSTLSPLPDNVPSIGYEATGVYQLGDEITPAASSGPLSTVVVDMSSWACETGGWNNSPSSCTTSPGATFPATITFNIYTPGNTATPEYTDTQTFNIPFRPTSNCPTDNTAWQDPVTDACYHGLETPITFNFASQDITLSGPVVYGIEYSTSDYGPSATPGLNESQPINALNVALDTESTDVSVGQDTNPGNDFASGVVGGGDWAPGEVTAATGTSGYNSYSTAAVGSDGFGSTNNIPAVQFNTSGAGLGDLFPGGASDTLNLNIANTGTSPAFVTTLSVAVASNGTDIESTPGDVSTVVPGCLASWFQVNNSPTGIGVTIPPGSSINNNQISVQLNESGTNQDACEGANVGLIFTSN
jgi:hypothetical protein